MIYIRGNKVIINKYIFYIPIMIGLVWYFIVPRVWAVFTYKRTTGIVTTFVDKKTFYITEPIIYPHPVITYRVADSVYTALGSAYQESFLHEDSTIQVMYNASDPSKNFINTFSGGWSPVAVYFGPTV